MIHHKQKFIFIHIPKSGGTSICKSLLNTESAYDKKDHNTYRKELEMPIYDDYFKFSIVRNPWARLVSLYYEKTPKYTTGITFSEYVKEICIINTKSFLLQKDKNALTHSSPYLDYWFKGIIDKIDFVGKFENIENCWKTISEGLNRKTSVLLKKRVGVYCKHYTEYYDDETKQIVAEKYAKDIEYFGYEFGD